MQISLSYYLPNSKMVIEKSTFFKSQLYKLNSEKSDSKWKYSMQYLAAILANLTSLSIGLNFGWSSPTLPILQSSTSPVLLTPDEISWVVSIQPLGDFVGAPISGLLADMVGRKKMMLISTIPHLAGWLLIYYSTSAFHLILARFLSGVASGMINQSMPMYIGEISVPEIRGSLGAGITLIVMLGITCINIIGAFYDMRMTALICASVPVITFFSFIWMPESPYYYIRNGDITSAKRSLRIFRKTENVDSEFENIRENVELQMKNPTSFFKIFSDPINRKIFSIVALVRIIQQSCGLSAITFYLQTIFKDSGLDMTPLAATLMYLTGQMISTLFCVLFCDKFGRVPLLLGSLIGAIVSMFFVGGYFFVWDYLHWDVSEYNLVPLVGMLGFITIFSIGYGTLPTLIAAEMFPTNIKSKAMILAHLIFAGGIFVSSKLFLFLQTNFGTFVPFWVYMCAAILGFVYTWFRVPETKGKSLEEIQKILNK